MSTSPLRLTATALLVAAMALAIAESAAAASLGSALRGLKTAPAARFIAERQPTLAPFAHVLFCLEQPGECASAGARSAVVPANAKAMAELEAVNRAVNRHIRPRYDASGALGDRWSVSPREGDCEDYAITKRHRLIAAGWPASSLRLAVAHTPGGEGHAVLVVRTSAGDLVLDNRTSRIKPWQDTGLHWVKIQSSRDPRLWYTL